MAQLVKSCLSICGARQYTVHALFSKYILIIIQNLEVFLCIWMHFFYSVCVSAGVLLDLIFLFHITHIGLSSFFNKQVTFTT